MLSNPCQGDAASDLTSVLKAHIVAEAGGRQPYFRGGGNYTMFMYGCQTSFTMDPCMMLFRIGRALHTLQQSVTGAHHGTTVYSTANGLAVPGLLYQAYCNRHAVPGPSLVF